MRENIYAKRQKESVCPQTHQSPYVDSLPPPFAQAWKSFTSVTSLRELSWRLSERSCYCNLAKNLTTVYFAKMEQNANLHRDTDGSSLCAPSGGETVDVTSLGGVKGTAEKCKNSEASLHTLVNVSCNNSSTNVSPPAAGNCVSSAGKSDVPEVSQVLSPHEETKELQAGGACSGSGDQISNGMGHDSVQAAGDSEGVAANLVNNQTDGLSSTAAQSAPGVPAEAAPCAKSAATKLAKPTHLCPDSASATEGSKPGLPSDHASPEALPRGSDPEPSLGEESRSIDSLESFSNLNSCPSSDLNSEGLEDRGLALALQSEYAADGAKGSCAKDRAAGQSIYHIKWIKWREENTPIITQNENGPCPLLAIMNVLLLAWKVDRQHTHAHTHTLLVIIHLVNHCTFHKHNKTLILLLALCR